MKFIRRLRYWFHHHRRHDLLLEEMESHIDAMAQELIGQGMPEAEARAAAHKKFGNMTLKAEDSRSTWIARWLNDALQDLAYGFRTLRRDAGFTGFALLIVGMGIGGSSAIFSVVNALLLRPLPFREPARLVWITNKYPEGGLSGLTVPVYHFTDLRDLNRSFSDIGAYFAFYSHGDNKLIGVGEPERLTGVPVTGNFFPVLGVKPQLGRNFSAEEAASRRTTAVLISHGLWKRRFASDPAIVGRALTIDDSSMTVVGVLPESFDFGSVFAPGVRIDLFFPFPLNDETNRWGNTLAMVGRLKPGASLERARAEARILGPQIRRRDPERAVDFVLGPLTEHVSGRVRAPLFVLASAAGLVMLIVCANLSNLLLARGATRQKELAIRAALGAGRSRLIRQMLTESTVLAVLGAVLGLALAFAATRFLARLDAISIPLLESVRTDFASVAFTLLLAVLAGVVFGLVPALQVPAAVVHDSLKDSSRGSSHGKHHAWIRAMLVVSEVTFACVLLVAAGLLIRSFLHVLDVNLGFRPEHAFALRVDPSSQYSTQERRNAYFDEVLRLTKTVPGIEAAGLTDSLPYGMNRGWTAGAKDRVYTPQNPPPAVFPRIVTDGYLKAMGIPLREGRDFTPHDNMASTPVIIINETLARTLWPGESAIGHIVVGGGPVDREVIGVVSDVRHLALEQSSGCEMYIPIRQGNDYASVSLVIRSALPTSMLAAAIPAALRPIEPNLPMNDLRTLGQIVDKAVSPRRFIVWLLAGFAAFALVLASLGIYAVISYSVNQRTQELGIRMALGATSWELQKRILAETLALSGAGMLAGLGAAWALARAMSGLLFGVSATDPVTFTAMLAVLTFVAAIAGYIPARRASRIDPMEALRAS